MAGAVGGGWAQTGGAGGNATAGDAGLTVRSAGQLLFGTAGTEVRVHSSAFGGNGIKMPSLAINALMVT